MFRVYRQFDSNDCGPTCLRMILRHFEKNVSTQQLRDLCFISREGISIQAMLNAATKLGFEAMALKAGFPAADANPDFVNIRELPLPFIAYTNKHFLVVYKISGDSVYVADPAKGKTKLKMASFEKLFCTPGAQHGKALVLEPGKDFDSITDPLCESTSTGQQVKFVLKYLLFGKRQLSLLFLALLLKLGLQLVSPYLTQKSFDSGILQKNLSVLTAILAIQLIMFVFNAGVSYAENILSNRMAARINMELVSDFVKKLFNVPLTYFYKRKSSDIIQRMQDLSKIESFLTYNFATLCLSVLSAIVLSVLLVNYNATVFLILLAYTFCFVVWTYYSLGKKRELNYEMYDIQVSAYSNLMDLVDGITEIKFYQNESSRIGNLLDNQKKYFRNTIRSAKINQLLGMGNGLISNIGYGFLTFYTAYLTTINRITIGELAAIQVIVLQIQSAVAASLSTLGAANDLKYSLERILEVYSLEEEATLSKSIQPSDTLSFENVSYAYSDVSPVIVSNVSFTIEKNTTTAIVGITGSGKSTLLKLALGILKPVDGGIFLGNNRLSDVDYYNYRKSCGIMSHDAHIFNDTIQNNIALSDEPFDMERFQNAIQLAVIDDFINSLPLKHNTMIGKGGLSVSSGQRQRLLIARMIYKDPLFIFMDEATNALDAETEARIMNNLDLCFHGKTRLIIAHRLSTIKSADAIIVIEGGKIIEQGAHYELLSLKGRYYNLVKEQLELS